MLLNDKYSTIYNYVHTYNTLPHYGRKRYVTVVEIDIFHVRMIVIET